MSSSKDESVTARIAENLPSNSAPGASPLDSDVSMVLPSLGGEGPDPRDWLAAIIAGSDDAIISMDLGGIIRSWNFGATRLFDYLPEEMLGQPITLIIPHDRLGEEQNILNEIRQGRRVQHFETQRRRKDGSIIDLSLTISPVRNARGAIVGASKIARDITERRRAQEAQKLLFGEMQHRIKNLFALTAGIVSLSGRSEGSAEQIVRTIYDRLNALSRAHDLTMSAWGREAVGEEPTDLLTLASAILEPYGNEGRITIVGARAPVGGQALANMALLLHELATNAAKYGGLAEPGGRIEVRVVEQDDDIALDWEEIYEREIEPPRAEGFGSRLGRSLAHALGATIDYDWRSHGLVVNIRVPRGNLAG